MTRAVAWLLVGAVAAAMLSGFFLDPHALGAHDWDYMETHRYFTVLSITEYGQFPFWDPFGCGGFPAWGSPESGTNVVSPFLPLYLLLPLGVALRLEIVLLTAALVTGTWFFASRYVRSPIALAFACIFGALSSRLALQVGVGHIWHFYYAALPWVLAAYDRRNVALGAAVLALAVYGGGIYPVPHTALALVGVAAYRAVRTRSWRPIGLVAQIGGFALLLAAPKLLPLLDTMWRFPRRVPSGETIPLPWWWRIFTARAADVPHRVPGLDYLWHEYGQYVGVVPLLAVVAATSWRVPKETRPLRFVGWAFMVLAVGGVGPWVLLHYVPPFSSQHVPSRFTYPAFMLLSIVAARVIEDRLRARARIAVAAVLAVCAGLVAWENARVVAPWFRLHPPAVAVRSEFVQYARVPPELSYGEVDLEGPRGVGGPAGLAVHGARVGSLECSLFSGLNHVMVNKETGRPSAMGARGIGDPHYRGEAFVEGEGTATIERFSPGEVIVRVEGASPGSLLVLNQNWDPSWRANGKRAVNHERRNAFVLGGESLVTFRYFPRTLYAGLVLALLGIAGLVYSTQRTGRALPP
jgi:hypothetical protein